MKVMKNMKIMKIMKIMKAVVNTLLLLSLFAINCLAHNAVVENGGELKYKSVRLTPEIYNYTNSDLSDILIKDENGQAVPYFINNQQAFIQNNSSLTAKIICRDSFVKDDYYYFDCKADIHTTDTRDITATVIEFDIKTPNKLYKLEIFGGYDGTNWEKIQNDVLYNVSDALKNRVEFSSPQKYTFYRFKTEKTINTIGSEKANLFGNVSIFYNEKIYRTVNFTQEIAPKFEVKEEKNDTLIEISGITNLKISKIAIETDSMFKRTVNSPVNLSKELYNLTFDNNVISDTTLDFDGRLWTGDIFTLKIKNNDDKPINVKGISLKYFADDLIFEGSKNAVYTIDFGKDETKKSPVYDIKAYKSEILKGDIDSLAIKEVKYDNDAPQKADNFDYKTIFNIVIGVVALLLMCMILLKLKGKSK